MGRDRTRKVTAAGGRFAVSGMGYQPDLPQVTYEDPGFVLGCETCSVDSFGSFGRLTPGMPLPGARALESRPSGMACYGSHETLIADRRGFEVISETGAYGCRSVAERPLFPANCGASTSPGPNRRPCTRSISCAACAMARRPGRMRSPVVAPRWWRIWATLRIKLGEGWLGTRSGRTLSTMELPLACWAARRGPGDVISL